MDAAAMATNTTVNNPSVRLENPRAGVYLENGRRKNTSLERGDEDEKLSSRD